MGRDKAIVLEPMDLLARGACPPPSRGAPPGSPRRWRRSHHGSRATLGRMPRSPVVGARLTLVLFGVVATACGPHAATSESTWTGPPSRTTTSATCAPPVPAGTSEVRAAIVGRDGGTCVAFVDEELSPIHARPAIWRRRGSAWTRLEPPFDPETVQNQGWVAVTSLDDTVVATLDSRVESTGWELTIVQSSDGGATWRSPVHFRSPMTLYKHPCNAELRSLRPNPDLLWPRDAVNIMVRDDRVDPAAATGRRHRYRVKTAVRWLRVVLHGFNRQPLVSTDYLFRVDGRGPISRTTDERGLLQEIVPAWALHATIEAGGYAWQVAIGKLVPTMNTPNQGQRGTHQRLTNLGYRASVRPRAVSTEAAGELAEAPFDLEVWRFQRREALTASGDVDDAVVHAAVKHHRV